MADTKRYGPNDKWSGEDLGRLHSQGILRKVLELNGITGQEATALRAAGRVAASRSKTRAVSVDPGTGVEAFLAPFKGSSDPLLVQSRASSLTSGNKVSIPDYRVLPPMTGAPLPFNHRQWLLDQMAMAPARTISVTGVVPPSSKTEFPLPRALGSVTVPGEPGPSSFIAPPASDRPTVVQVTGVGRRDSRKTPDRALDKVSAEVLPDAPSEVPYGTTDRQIRQRELRLSKPTIDDKILSEGVPTPDLSDMPEDLKLLQMLVQANKAAAAASTPEDPVREISRKEVRDQYHELTDTDEAAKPGGLLEWVADRSQQYVNALAAYHRASSRQDSKTEEPVDDENGSFSGLRLPSRKGEVQTSDMGGSVPLEQELQIGHREAGAVRSKQVSQKDSRAEAVKVEDMGPTYSYNYRSDPLLPRAQHVKAWAHALLTGDTSVLDHTTDEIGIDPVLSEDDLPQQRKNYGAAAMGRLREKTARALGIQRSIQHPVHQDLVSDHTSDISGGNFLYRLARDNGVDPNEGHADKILENATRTIEEAPRTVANRSIGYPPAKGKIVSSRSSRSSIFPVTRNRWLQMAYENIGNAALGLPQKDLPPLFPDQEPPSAEKLVPGDDTEALAGRAALQQQIDRWKGAVTPDIDVVSSIARSQAEAAKYVPQFLRTQSPAVTAPEQEQEEFQTAFRSHRSGLIDAYRRSPAGASLFQGGTAGQAAAVALGSATKKTRERNHNGAKANGLEI